MKVLLFWKGAVHIDDVAAAVLLSVDLISRQKLRRQLILSLIVPMNIQMPI
jgi:hypothetical protein